MNNRPVYYEGNTVYLYDWASNHWDTDAPGKPAMMADFQIAESGLEGVEILLAYYTYRDYSGDAFVLFRKGGKLYEVNGSHCSCYGLEGQWQPEETSTKALRSRISKGYLGDGSYYGEGFDDLLIKILDWLDGATPALSG